MVSPFGPTKTSAQADPGMVVLGRIAGVFGVKGWVKVYSHTDPLENILGYSPWLLREASGWREYRLAEGKRHGKGLVARLEGFEDRDQASRLNGCDICVPRDRLPTLDDGDYYWSDLEGLRVQTLEGVDLGTVSHLFDTGANDVLVVKGDKERLLPYDWGQVVKRVDLEAGLIQVDWDPDF